MLASALLWLEVPEEVSGFTIGVPFSKHPSRDWDEGGHRANCQREDPNPSS